MEVTEFNGVPVQTLPKDGLAGGQSLAETFDNFLLLLTTQLQNQDPLDPLDSNQFTEQLVNFTGVEQAVNTNKKLDQLIDLQGTSQAAAAVGYIDREVEMEGDRVMLQDGRARVAYELTGNAADTTIVISNQSGDVVGLFEGSTDAGRHELQWDGTDIAGAPLPAGIYNVAVRAVDRDNGTVATTTSVFGRVTGVQSTDDGMDLLVGELTVPLDQVKSVRVPEETGTGA